ncbi:MAG: glutaredoxin [Clostridiales bacterium]|nr:glutaredoxin [Clostridiales bacterium]
MKIIMYGADFCPDCVEAKEQLKDCDNIQLEYRNITEKISYLKEFLQYRDKEAIFNSIKENGKVGIPFFILEDGNKTFDIFEHINVKKAEVKPTVNVCSIDGTGCC